MQIRIKLLFIFLITAITSVIVFYSCDIPSPTEGLEIRIKSISRSTTVPVAVLNAATLFPIQEEVEITFSGEGRNDIISTTSVPLDKIKTDEGIGQFSVNDSIVPTIENPFKVILVCKADGYITTSLPVELTKPGIKPIEIIMVKNGELPEGTISNTQTTGSATVSGGTSNPITISSGIEPNTNASAEISLPQGARLIGEDGEYLSGEINTSITYFNPVDHQSLLSFPGGFEVTVENENGEMEETRFATAGFIALEMTVGGVPVDEIENGSLSLKMDIPADLINPETSETVKAGDIIPIWSYDEKTGEWAFEENLTIESSPESPTGLGIKFQNISHFSFWNLDWKLGKGCATGTTIKFISTTGIFINPVIARLYYESVPGSGNFDAHLSSKYIYPAAPEWTFIRAMAERPVQVRVFVPNTSIQLNTGIEAIIPDLCDENNITYIPFTPTDTTIIGTQVTISATVICKSISENPIQVSIENIPVYVKRVDTIGNPLPYEFWTYIGAFSQGELPDVTLQLEKYYIFKWIYDNYWYYSIDYEPPFYIDSPNIHYDIIDYYEICKYF